MTDGAADEDGRADETGGSGADGAANETLVEVVRARGHGNVTAEHGSTLEVTGDDFLTPAGDCILAIDADRVPADFDAAFVAACRDAEATITATVETDEHEAEISGRGHPDLSFENERSHVLRTSDYVDDRTVMIGADRAAVDLDRDLVTALADGGDVTLRIRVVPAE